MEKGMLERLKILILERSFQYSETPIFKLVHGGMSNFYFNCKKVTLDPEGQFLIGNLFFERVKKLGVKAIGGLTLGADPIAMAVSYTSWLKGNPISAFVVRKEPKGHGAMTQIEGNLKPGDRVVVVDDVITTGGSTIKAIEVCQAAGVEVCKVIVLVDREEMDGRANIERLVPDVEALVTRSEIIELYHHFSSSLAKDSSSSTFS
ncbi:MAG: orotate phosphoribosyltransferase [Syntrophobacterales bacterium]|nr:orotate phosphoribosyltransferase [Syntrophobacterales bacterium]